MLSMLCRLHHLYDYNYRSRALADLAFRPNIISLRYLCRWVNSTLGGLKTMKVNKTDATIPQPKQHQQPSKPKPRSTNDDFKKVFEAEVNRRYGDKVASKVIFL